MKNNIAYLLSRDLKTLIIELEAYQNEADMWKVEQSINNSAGSLALHLVGNLNHFVGHILGGTNYKRDRAFEFSGNVVSRDEVIEKIEQTIEMINSIIPKFSTDRLNQPFEFNFLGKHKTSFYLLHFTTHLSYHLGQINYHRRLLTTSVS